MPLDRRKSYPTSPHVRHTAGEDGQSPHPVFEVSLPGLPPIYHPGLIFTNLPACRCCLHLRWRTISQHRPRLTVRCTPLSLPWSHAPSPYRMSIEYYLNYSNLRSLGKTKASTQHYLWKSWVRQMGD